MGFFPYATVRGGQSQMIVDCKTALESKSNLLVHAPTGIGKTAAVLSESLEYALKNKLTVFFLTPKHTQHTIVVDTVQNIREKHNVKIKLIDLIGKQWMCPHKVCELTSQEFNQMCKAQKKDELCEFYNNTKRAKLTNDAVDAVENILSHPMHNEQVQLVCAEKKLCPYEVLLAAGRSADIIVCDYFHIFSPGVREALFAKLDTELSFAILIVDEAHNLPHKIRSIMSNSIGTKSLKQAGVEAKNLGFRELAHDMSKISDIVKSFSKGLRDGGEKYIDRLEFHDEVQYKTKVEYDELTKDIESLGMEVLKIPNRYRSYSQAVAKFLKRWAGPEVGYSRILSKDHNQLKLSHRCMDPSIVCTPIFQSASSSILMSGTLTPLHMYTDVLGVGAKKTIEAAYPCPFPQENRLSLIVPGYTTKYSERTDFMWRKYALLITQCLREIPGNAAVFFPSYSLLNEISSAFKTEKEIICERQNMSKEERANLFKKISQKTFGDYSVLCGVSAGSFAEGLDFADNLLDAVIIVGLPLEKPDLETQSLIEYYDFKFERGFDYGYIYPAMNRTLQAAGRGIRSETDRGVILLLDERFSWMNYKKCFPTDHIFYITEEPVKYLQRFFSIEDDQF